jgi:hypothetical protein
MITGPIAAVLENTPYFLKIMLFNRLNTKMTAETQHAEKTEKASERKFG